MFKDKNLMSISTGEMREFERLLAEEISAKEAREVIAKQSFGAWLREKAREITPDIDFSNVDFGDGVKLPSWYRSPADQIETVKKFIVQYAPGVEGFGAADIPAVPTAPLDEDEVYLLVVNLPADGTRRSLDTTLDAWWDSVKPPEGLTRTRYAGTIADARHIRLRAGGDLVPGMRWMAFNPKACYGKSCNEAAKLVAAKEKTLAGVEVVQAVALFPDWAKSWNGSGSPCPNATAVQVKYEADWSGSLYVSRWDDGRELELGAHFSGSVGSHWASPVVREF
jgi:hypothetical protein